MAGSKINLRIWYLLCFLIILITEVLIALFVRDSFIRPQPKHSNPNQPKRAVLRHLLAYCRT